MGKEGEVEWEKKERLNGKEGEVELERKERLNGKEGRLNGKGRRG